MIANAAREPTASSSPKTAIVGGLLVIVFGLGGFLGWGITASLDSGVAAQGTLAIETNRKKVQHPDGGVVRELLVQDGDLVTAGDVLIRLDDTEARAGLEIIRARLDTAQAMAARLSSERADLSEIAFPESLLSRAADPKVGEMLMAQRTIFEARRKSYLGEVDILEQRIKQVTEDIVGLTAQREAIKRQRELIDEELVSLRHLYDQGHAAKPRVLELERAAARLQGEYGEKISEIARAHQAIGETRLQILQRHTVFREEVAIEWREVQSEIYDLEERRAAATNIVDHIELRAPSTGTVVGMQVHTIGAVIASGEALLEIVPSGDRLIAEARIEPIHVDNVLLGQPANIRLTGLTQRSTPYLNGTVSYLSADAMADDRTGQRFFKAQITVPEDEVARLNGVVLHPGMPTEVIIKTGERTPMQYLMQPIIESINRAWREQ